MENKSVNSTDKKGEGKESRAFFQGCRDLLKNTFDGVVVYEAVGEGNDFIILDVNNAAERIDGIRRDDVVGKKVSRVFPGIRNMEFMSVLTNVWKTGKPRKQPAVIYKDNRISGWRENNVFKLPTGEVVAVYRDLTAEKKASEAVSRSEKRCRTMFELMTDIVFLIDTDLRLIMINDAGMKIARSLGVKGKLTGKMFFEAIPFLQESLKDEYEDIIRTGKPFSGEVKYFIGRKILVGQTKRIPMVDNGVVTGIIGVIQDITKLEENEIALRKNIERFNYIASLAGEMIWESDMKGRITYISPAVERILGYKSGDLVGKKRYAELLFSEDREKVESLLKKAYEQKEEFHNMVVFAAKKNGEKVALELSGAPALGEEGGAVGYIGIAGDVTDRQAYEENLRKFKSAVENASDHIIITDENGTIIYANKAASEITGFPIKEMMGKNPSIWGKQMPVEFYKDMWHRIKDLKETFVGELTNKRKNGELYIAESRISSVLGKDGNIRFFVDIERDITKAKEIDRAKTEFVSLASHQLRTPLSIINWYSEGLLNGDKGPLTEDQRDYVDEVHKSNHRMIELVNALLNTSRIDMGTLAVSPKRIDLVEISDIVLSELAPQIGQKKINVVKQYGKVPKIDADPDLMRVVLQNLLSNAVKYTGDNGKVSIKISKNKQDMVITISDNGCGIPASQQSKIFSKFFRADNARAIDQDGNGLGLYITKAVVDAGGGTIRFRSEEGKGTEFTVTFPPSGMKQKKGIKSLIQ